MDGAVHASAAEQGGVGRVDDGVYVLLGDVALHQADFHRFIVRSHPVVYLIGSQMMRVAAGGLAGSRARGVESPALAELAGLGRTDVREAADLFAAAMAELGHPLRDHHEVRLDRARFAARALLDGARSAREAIAEIASLLCLGPDEHPDARYRQLTLDTELLVIDWDEQPQRRHATETLMIQAAQQLLALLDTEPG